MEPPVALPGCVGGFTSPQTLPLSTLEPYNLYEANVALKSRLENGVSRYYSASAEASIGAKRRSRGARLATAYEGFAYQADERRERREC